MSRMNKDINDVSVIDAATNTVIGTTILVGTDPEGVVVNPAGTRVYVANFAGNTVSVIDTATNTVIGTPISVGTNPHAFGQFIAPVQPATVWAGHVSFSARATSVKIDNSGNRSFLAFNEPFAGTMSLYVGASGPTKSAEGCFLKFLGDDGTTICINDIAAIATESTKSRSEKTLLIGSGVFMTTFQGNQVTGVAYMDAKGTLKEDPSSNLTSIGLSGKIAGGVDSEFVFGGNFNTTLAP